MFQRELAVLHQWADVEKQHEQRHMYTHTHTYTVALSLTESRPHVCSKVLSSQRACVISQLQLWLQWL